MKHLPITSYISKRPSMTRSCLSTRKVLFANPVARKRRKLLKRRREKKKRVPLRHTLISLMHLRGKVWTSGRPVQDLFAHRTVQKCRIQRQSKLLRNFHREPSQCFSMKMKYVCRPPCEYILSCAHVLHQFTASSNVPKPKGKRAMDSFLEEIKK